MSNAVRNQNLRPVVNKSKNQINVIYPYRTSGGTWVYDDEDLDVYAEAFVCGSSELIDMLVGTDCNNFTAYISTKPIPKHKGGINVKLVNIDEIVSKEEDEEIKALTEGETVSMENYVIQGWYQMDGTEHRNWFCGHLLDYFEGYPKEIHVQIVKK